MIKQNKAFYPGMTEPSPLIATGRHLGDLERL